MPESPAILFVRSSRRCTGLERRLLWIATATREAGFAPHIAVLYREPGQHPLLALAASRGLPATQIADPAPGAPSTLLALRDLIRQTRPAIIHTQDYRSDLLAWIARRLAGSSARLLATCHGHTAATPALRLYEALDRRALRAFERVIGVSAYQRRLLLQWGLTPAQAVHIPHCVEPGWDAGLPAAARQDERRRWGLADDEFVIGFLGRSSPEKGLDTLERAFAAFAAGEPRARLCIAGDAPAGAAGRDRRILRLGYLDDVRPALLACDLIAIPSRREAFGLTALEALALGRPVLASDVGGLPEIVRAGVSGWLAPADDAPAWSAALREIGRDAPARREFGERGRADVWARFPACQISQDMIALYRSLL